MSLEPQPRGVVEGPVGERPQEEVTRWLDRLEVDWAGRQLGWTLDGDTLYVNNRFHLAAYQLATGQRLWQTAVPESMKVPRSRDWSLVAMTPRIDGNRIFARILYGDGPLLGCWDSATGQNVWLADQLQGVHVASDPWVFQDRLLAFTVTRTENSDALLRLATFDALTGELLGQTDILQMRSSWYARHCCETTLAGDMLIASLGGAVAACNLRGQVRWVRRQATLPSEEEGEWVLQALEAPLVSTRMGAEGVAGLRHGEHCLLADQPADMAAAIERLLDDRTLAARLSAAGRALVRASYDWSAIVPQLEALYQRAGVSAA